MKKLNKLMAALLALVMCLSLLPMSVFAEEVPDQPTKAGITADSSKNGFESAEKDYTSAAGDYTSANNHSGSAIKDASTVTDGMNKITSDLKDEVERQQEAVDTAAGVAKDAVDKITSGYNDKVVDTDKLTSDANGKTSEAQTAIDYANQLLSNANVSAADKRAAAQTAVDIAEEAVKAAEEAQQAVSDTEAARVEAQNALDAAKEAYEKAVADAQTAVGDAKAAAEAKVAELQKTFADAKSAYERAEEFKKAAEVSLEKAKGDYENAQELLKQAEELYTSFEWPDEEYTQADVANKLQSAQDATSVLEQERKKADENVETAKKGIEATQAKLDGGTVNADGEHDKGLLKEQEELKEKSEALDKLVNEKLKPAQDARDEAVETYNTAYAEQEKLEGNIEYNDKNASDQVGAGNQLEGMNMPEWIKQNKAYVIEFVEKYFASPDEFNNSEYSSKVNEWAQKNLFDEAPEGGYKLDLSEKGLDEFDSEAGKYFQDVVAAAKHKYETLKLAEKNLTDAQDAVKSALPENMSEKDVTEQQKQMSEQLEKLGQEIKDIQEQLDEQQKALETLEKTAGDAKKNVEDNQEAIKKLTALKDLKDKVDAAKTAIENAEAAKAKADEAQKAAEKAKSDYLDAEEAVQAAAKALEAKLEASLKTGVSFDELEAYKAKLDELKAALSEAEAKKEQAEKDAEDAKKDADQAKKDADDAKTAADNARDTYVEDFAALDDEVEIDEPAVPLASGPITRAEFIDYLWRHEGEPASAGVCTFTDVEDTHQYFDALCWADENGVAEAYFNAPGHEDGTFEPDELVTVGAAREFLDNFANVFGTNAVDVADLTTLTGADDEAVLNCDQVLAEFFGEEYVVPEDLDSLETDTAA